MRVFTVSIVLIILFAPGVLAQWTNVRVKKVCAAGDTLILDRLSTIPGTLVIVTIDGDTIKDSYSFDASHSKLFFTHERSECYYAHYRVFPYNITKPFNHRSFSEYKDSLVMKGSMKMRNEDDSLYTYVPENKLFTNGSISRGISIGNNQDLILNSSMNMQIQGTLTDNVNIRANITDSNIPIQADGTSQQLQDFDKVYISLYDDKRELIVGDFETTHNNGNFLKYNKKAQGGKAIIHSGKKNAFYNDFSIAVSKGKYCKQELDTKEGVQGPYKIFGCNNELYIIILSGSEKVYADGKLLTRGESNDYTFDYNSAELTFTSNFFITEYTRIQVEFEYSDQNYSRILISSNNEIKTKKNLTWVNLFVEQDNKNSPLLQDLEKEDRELLSLSGDMPAYTDGGILDTSFNENTLYYRKQDTLVNENMYEDVYIYSTDQEQVLYRVHFSFVGEGNGSYVLNNSAINGKVYRWIAPGENGESNGNYDAVSELIAPRLKQLVAVGTSYQLLKNTKLQIELAGSRNDMNTFSKYDSNDDFGYAGMISLSQNFTTKDSALQSGATLRYHVIQKDFAAVNNFRNVEYQRELNIKLDSLAMEHSIGASFFMLKPNSKIKYETDYVLIEDMYAGFKNELYLSHANKHNYVQMQIGYLTTNASGHSSDYIWYSGKYKRMQRYFVYGINNDLEYNKWLGSAQTIDLNSVFNNSSELYVTNNDSLKLRYYLSVKLREDKAADTLINAFAPLSFAEDYSAKVSYELNAQTNIATSIIYRELKFSDTLVAKEENLLGRLDFNTSLFKRFIDFSFKYDMGSGLENMKDYVYVAVPKGTGVYKWDEYTDYNKNGIAERNEFEIANFEYEANYIKIQLPTSEYQKIKTFSLNATGAISMNKIFRKQKGMSAFIGRFSGKLAYRLHSKNTTSDLLKAWLPGLDITDTLLVSQNSLFRNTIYFNKSGSIFRCNYYFNSLENKFSSVNGYEIRKSKTNGINSRIEMFSKLTYEQTVELENERSIPEASFLQNKNYHIKGYKLQPKLLFQPNMNYQFSVEYSYVEKDNIILNKEHVEQNNIGFKLIYSHPKRGRFQGEFHFINIVFDGDESTSIAYKLLEGLNSGKNYVWNVNYNKNLNKSLQVQLSYSGRKNEMFDTIHTGSIQLKAFF